MRRFGRWGPARPHAALLAVIALVAAAVPVAMGQCIPLSAEFVLTGLSRADGNRANHEIGICLPQLQVNVSTNCMLTVKPKYSTSSYISLLVTGRDAEGRHNVPLASDSAAAIAEAVNKDVGYYYLEPHRCPQSYSMKIKGSKLLAADIATLLRKGIGVGEAVLPAVTFTPNGMTISWKTTGPVPQELSYTAIAKTGGPTIPDFAPFRGSPNSFCSLLDINPAYDLDTNPADGIVDASTATLVGRLPRQIPGRPGFYVCAIAPAGGYVKVRRSAGLALPDPIRYVHTADVPNAYVACNAGQYLYRLGAIAAPGDPTTDSCQPCPRGSYATSSASACIACPPNNYQDKPGQRACKPCQFGYAPYAGAVRCLDCYYGRPYCSEGYSSNEAMFTCNSMRLPEGYSPEVGYSIVRPLDDPTDKEAAAKYSPMFKNCNVNGGGASLIAFNVSAECKVDMYVLGDLGRGGGQCSQDPVANAITAYYTSPDTIATMTSPGNGQWQVAFAGSLDADGLVSRVFATSTGTRVPDEFSQPTTFKLVLPESGFSYLGGGDNGQGQNANVKGVNFDPCPAGTIKEALNGDGKDDPGEDPNTLLSHFCVPCGVGTYCPSGGDGGGGAGPQNCPAGTFGPILGAKSAEGCVNCPIGTFQDMDGSFTCQTCAPNTFASAPGATECISCGDGYEVSSAGSNSCNPCSPGLFRDSAVSEQCQECPAGTSSGEAAGKCAVCEPGTYAANPKSSACAECPRGSYQRSYGQRKCELCPVGTYGDSRGRSACKVCPVGTYNANCGSVTATSCLRCPAGKAAPRPGSGGCSSCGAGYFSDRMGLSSCRACPAGTFTKDSGSKACHPCPKGTFADKSASKACAPCPVGFFSPAPGAARCMSCPAGAFTSSPGAWNCARCQPGTYSTKSAAGSAITCAVCPPGTYTYSEGATQCLLCPPGQYADGSGSTSCNVCPLGTFSAGTGSQRCTPCKGGWTTMGIGSTGAGDCSVRVMLNGG